MGHEQGDSVHSRALNVVPERDGIFGGLGVHPHILYLTILSVGCVVVLLAWPVRSERSRARADRRAIVAADA